MVACALDKPSSDCPGGETVCGRVLAEVLGSG
jgi:hypothetical protein